MVSLIMIRLVVQGTPSPTLVFDTILIFTVFLMRYCYCTMMQMWGLHEAPSKRNSKIMAFFRVAKKTASEDG